MHDLRNLSHLEMKTVSSYRAAGEESVFVEGGMSRNYDDNKSLCENR